ncbi:multidrug and toxin extrusion protein 1 [Stylonychia lemnae]|uniref:Multidrug and toxin extrusion protein 1 n=1 Tax=Stylonychia lemnae TaxID=5949 RepID=A0A078AWR3_STYLE|nr:multidrug and toxin extrusion protein 1 [Stylonychia lemnae]|eukprot:CDW86604.1 multidrug and toxin extrusion protein 1 [Stylonychia lemnae]
MELNQPAVQKISKFQLAKDIMKIAIPGMIASMSFGLVEAMNLMFMGQFGDPTLVAGVGLGNVYIMIFGILTICGLNAILSTLITNILLMAIFISLEKDLKEAFFWPNRQSFNGLWEYVKLALPSMLLWSIFSWAYQIQTIIISTVSNDLAAAQSIIHNMIFLLYMMTVGLTISSSALIGKSIGSNNIPQGKDVLRVLSMIGVSLGIIQWFTIQYFGKYLTSVFTNDENIQQIIGNVTYLISLNTFFGCTSGWLVGVIRGLGILKQATAGIFVFFYIIGLPLQCYLLFCLELGITAIWGGILVSQILCTIYYIFLIFFLSDWNQIASESIQRSENEKLQKQKNDIANDDKQNQINDMLIPAKLINS